MTEAKVAVETTIAGTTVKILRSDLEDEDCAQNPNFFDEDFTVAAATGFTVWDGAWAMIELLKNWLGDELKGKKTLELGSGTGLAGLAAAAVGSNILLTDITSVTNDMLIPNIRANATSLNPVEPSIWGVPSYTIGRGGGTAAAHPLDWTKPLPENVNLRDIEVVIASEVVWLKELVQPFASTLSRLLKDGGSPVCYVVCRERANAESQTFAKIQDVLDILKGEGFDVTAVSDQMGPEAQPTVTFKVTPCRA
eukprot:TRINITY_DN10416_c0_g1_i1.p1 TRINITY_DN10416_c0_g1~~TRINITY_DN10416_c0_g1_i1.p1  ORF type:complete len:252 (+),score=24.43 TRINITY_DN10416_c0_g1_i1:451-1206(+)